MIDFLEELRRIQSKSTAETFDRATDSLEAIRDFIAAMMGVGPPVGLWMFGICDPAMAASQNTIVTNNLTGMTDDIFNDQFWMQVIYNADAPGTLPEGEIRRITGFVAATQTFTVDPFTVNVEANDLICIFHESILSMEILATGTLTTSSVNFPADNTRTEADQYFRGCLLMPTEGACRFQPRLILYYTVLNGIFTLDPSNPFTAAPGLVDYVIVRGPGSVGGAGLDVVAGVHVHADNIAEQQVFIYPFTRPTEIDTIYLDLFTLTQNADIRVKHQIDGANLRTIETFNWTVGMDDGVYFRKIAVDDDLEVTIQSTALEGAPRNVPYKYFTKG